MVNIKVHVIWIFNLIRSVAGVPRQPVGDPVGDFDEREEAAAEAQPHESSHLWQIVFNFHATFSITMDNYLRQIVDGSHLGLSVERGGVKKQDSLCIWKNPAYPFTCLVYSKTMGSLK